MVVTQFKFLRSRPEVEEPRFSASPTRRAQSRASAFASVQYSFKGVLMKDQRSFGLQKDKGGVGCG